MKRYFIHVMTHRDEAVMWLGPVDGYAELVLALACANRHLAQINFAAAKVEVWCNDSTVGHTERVWVCEDGKSASVSL